VGICCAKLGEAEVFVDAGIDDIRLPYPVSPSNASRVIALMDRASISIIIDHLDVARGWSDAMTRAGRTLDVLIKVDVGFHRCGIDPAGDAPGFITSVASLRGLKLRGLLSHAGHAYHAASLDDCALTVAATVVSKHPGRIILDCGSKTLTSDQFRGATKSGGYGVVLEGDGESPRRIDASLTIERLSEEHATVRVTGATR